MKRAPHIATWMLALTACQPMRTEVLVVTDTDLSTPDELDELRIDFVGPSGEIRRSEGAIVSASDLPRTVGLVDQTNSARMVRITVTGLLRGANVIQRRAVFTFVPGETRILRMDLLRGCIGVSCPSDQTCGDNGCRSVVVGIEELRPYDPNAVDRLDAAFDAGVDGGRCIVGKETCNERDDDCDDRIDEDFDLVQDVRHCGSCTTPCPSAPANASSVCGAGSCALRCDPGFDDCNGRMDDGCEQALTEPEHCGDCLTSCSGAMPFCQRTADSAACVSGCTGNTTNCGGACVELTSDPLYCGDCTTRCTAPANAVATCVSRSCGYECDMGFADCDGLEKNGCESTLRELENCGGCGQRCERSFAVTSCSTGSCRVVGCDPLYGDCDLMADNGCEEDLSQNPSRCGTCATMCVSAPANATSACVAGRCELSCNEGFGNCDTMPETGCEQRLDSPNACGVCGVTCTDPTPLCAVVEGGATCVIECTAGQLCASNCVDTASDARNCGDCDRVCMDGLNAQPICTAGNCSLECVVGFADCDHDGLSCETATSSDTANCGGCDLPCPVPANSIASCSNATCTSRCQLGYEDCNTMAGDGCEVDITTDMAHCGLCDRACTLTSAATDAACVGGACRITACEPPYVDCDDTFANGCEIDISADPSHCGTCERACAGDESCCAGACMVGGC